MTAKREIYHPLTGELIEDEMVAICIEQGYYNIAGDPPVLYIEPQQIVRNYRVPVTNYHKFTAKEAIIFDKLCHESFMTFRDLKDALGLTKDKAMLRWLRHNRIPIYQIGDARGVRYKVFSGDVVRAVAACELPTEGDPGIVWNGFLDWRAGRVDKIREHRKARRERAALEAKGLQKRPSIRPSRLPYPGGPRAGPGAGPVQDHDDHGGGGPDSRAVAEGPGAERGK